jgi:hypothetical protein
MLLCTLVSCVVTMSLCYSVSTEYPRCVITTRLVTVIYPETSTLPTRDSEHGSCDPYIPYGSRWRTTVPYCSAEGFTALLYSTTVSQKILYRAFKFRRQRHVMHSHPVDTLYLFRNCAACTAVYRLYISSFTQDVQ